MLPLRFLLFSVSFHAKTLRLRTTSTCLCFWNSLADNNLGCFCILSLGPVIIQRCRPISHQNFVTARQKPKRVRCLRRVEWVSRCQPERSGGERGTYGEDRVWERMIHSLVKNEIGLLSILGCPTTSHNLIEMTLLTAGRYYATYS